MKKILLIILLILTACGNSPHPGYASLKQGFVEETVVIAVGETYILDIATQYRDISASISRIKVSSSDSKIVKVSNQKLVGKAQGRVVIEATFYDDLTAEYYRAKVGEAYVYDLKKIKLLNNANDLNNIRNDLGGHYLLNNDIDLSSYNWNPIGEGGDYAVDPWQDIYKTYFSGVLINPFGYTISNLTIDGDAGFSKSYAALFHGINTAFVSGLIMTDVYINNTAPLKAFDGEAAAIAGDANYSLISNCQVEGVIIGSGSVGGVVANNSISSIINCSFTGTLEGLPINDPDFASWYPVYVGGIAGYDFTMISYGEGGIFNCQVSADLVSHYLAGGIAGYARRSDSIINASFVGTINGLPSHVLIGLAKNEVA